MKSEHQVYFETEDTHWWFTVRREILKSFISLIPNHREKHVLEIGCGSGGNLKYLFSDFKARSGLEYNPEGVELSRKKLGNAATIHRGDANRLSEISERYDVVAFLDVLYHEGIKDHEKVISEAANLLLPGGHILITDGAYNTLAGKHSKNVQSARRFTRSELCQCMEKAGLEVIKASYWGIILFFLLLIKRKVAERWLNSEENSPDVKTIPLVDNIFFGLIIWELPFIKHFSLPFGSSVALLAKKNI